MAALYDRIVGGWVQVAVLGSLDYQNGILESLSVLHITFSVSMSTVSSIIHLSRKIFP